MSAVSSWCELSLLQKITLKKSSILRLVTKRGLQTLCMPVRWSGTMENIARQCFQLCETSCIDVTLLFIEKIMKFHENQWILVKINGFTIGNPIVILTVMAKTGTEKTGFFDCFFSNLPN